MLKKVIVFAVMILFLVAAASAYVINFESPSNVESDSSFVITGTSTLPAGFTSSIEFYKKAQVGNNKVAEESFTIQDGGLWSVYVDTSGWQAGVYTMSISKNSEYSYGSSSTLLKTFTVTENLSAGKGEAAETAATAEKTALPELDNTEVPEASSAAVSGTASTPVSLWICLLGIFGAFLIVNLNAGRAKPEKNK